MRFLLTRGTARRLSHPGRRISLVGRGIGLLAGLALTGIMAVTAQAQIVNPVSAFPITVDGRFTDGLNSNGTLRGEWSDITPVAFISPPTDAGTLFTVPVGDPRANSLLYAGIGPDKDSLYLMYDYSARTNPVFFSNEKFASIKFPVDLPKNQTFGNSGRRNIDVQFVASGFSNTAVGNPFRVIVHADAEGGDPGFDINASALGLTGAFSFGPSTLSSQNHLLVELEVPLEIPEGFGTGGSGLGPAGLDPVGGGGAGYSPDPAFWGGNFVNDLVDPPISSAIFQIMPNGSTLIIPAAPLASVPEPSAWALTLSGGVASLLAYRRRRQSA